MLGIRSTRSVTIVIDCQFVHGLCRHGERAACDRNTVDAHLAELKVLAAPSDHPMGN